MAKISVRVTPFAKIESMSLSRDIFGDSVYEVRVTEPPEDGRANQSVIEILAKYFNVSKSDIKLILGEKNRSKVFEIMGK